MSSGKPLHSTLKASLLQLSPTPAQIELILEIWSVLKVRKDLKDRSSPLEFLNKSEVGKKLFSGRDKGTLVFLNATVKHIFNFASALLDHTTNKDLARTQINEVLLQGVAASTPLPGAPRGSQAPLSIAAGFDGSSFVETPVTATASAAGGVVQPDPQDKDKTNPEEAVTEEPVISQPAVVDLVADAMSEPVNKNFLPAHCDKSCPPGGPHPPIDGFSTIKFDQAAGDSPPGAALYCPTSKHADCVDAWTDIYPVIQSVYAYSKALELKGLDADANPSNTELEELQEVGSAKNRELASIKSHYDKFTEGLNKMQKLKDRLANGYLKMASIQPWKDFMEAIISPQDTLKHVVNLWIQKRAGLNDSVLGTASNNSTLGQTMFDPMATMNATAKPATFDLKMGGFKLPAVETRKFSGKPEDFLRWRADWNNFYDRYLKQGAIDYHIMMNYVQQAMPDNLKKLLKTYTFDKSGYDAWFKELQNRFGDTTHLINVYRSQMTKLQHPKDHPDSIDTFKTKVQEAVLNLNQLNITTAAEGDTWLSYLLPKLTPSMMVSWETYEQTMKLSQLTTYEAEPRFNHWWKWINDYTVRERTKALQASVYNTDKGHKGKGGGQKGNGNGQDKQQPSTNAGQAVASAAPAAPTTSAPTTNATTSAGPKRKRKKQDSSPEEYKSEAPKTCCFCRGSHPPAKCNNDNNKDMMWKAVYDHNLCHSCLRLGHRPPKCKDKKKCSAKKPDGTNCPHYHNRKLHSAKYLSVQDWEAQKKA